MTDKELAKAADAAFRKTTITYPAWVKKVNQGVYPAEGPPSQWGIGFGLLADIGLDPPPPATNWPASYTTGPLGANNILPAAGKTLLIEYPGGPGQTWATMQTRILALETDMGRKFDGIQTEYYWQKGSLQPNELSDHRLEWAHTRGQTACLSAHVEYSIAETNAGAADATWTAIAIWLRSLGFPVMMRLWWEFDNTPGAFPWCVGGTPNIGGPFVTAWKRVVAIFKAQAASNVGFWWCPLEGGDRNGVNQSYPGDTFVDWVGSDVYNSCYVGETGCWTTPLHAGWASFAEAALYPNPPVASQYSLWSPKKPFVWGEVGCVYDKNAASNLKGDWFRGVPAALKAKGPLACGISFFDQNVSGFEGGKANWLVDYPVTIPDVIAGFKQMAQTL